MHWKPNYRISVILLVSILSIMAINGLNQKYLSDNDYINTPIPSQSGLTIMTSINIPADLVSNILGEHGTVESIVPGGADIHSFPGPTATQKQKMADSDLFFATGLVDLEPWLSDALDSLGSEAPTVVYLIEESMMVFDPLIDDLNPHVWMDPNVVKKMTSNITAELINLDSANSASYTSNNATYQSKLNTILTYIEGNRTGGYLAGGYQNLKMVVNHPAFTPFFNLLDINQTDVIEKIEGQEPSASYIAKIITNMTRDNVKLMVSQPQVSQVEVNSIARQVSAKIAMLTPELGVTGVNGQYIDTYIEMIEYNLWALANPVDPPADIPGYDTIVIGLILLGSISMGMYLLRKRISFN